MPDIQQLLIEEMQDLLHAEGQLVKALPKMAKAAKNPDLKQAFQEHLEQTNGHVERLNRAFELLGVKPKSKPCKGMEGLVEEGSANDRGWEGETGFDCRLGPDRRRAKGGTLRNFRLRHLTRLGGAFGERICGEVARTDIGRRGSRQAANEYFAVANELIGE